MRSRSSLPFVSAANFSRFISPPADSSSWEIIGPESWSQQKCGSNHWIRSRTQAFILHTCMCFPFLIGYCVRTDSYLTNKKNSISRWHLPPRQYDNRVDIVMSLRVSSASFLIFQFTCTDQQITRDRSLLSLCFFHRHFMLNFRQLHQPSQQQQLKMQPIQLSRMCQRAGSNQCMFSCTSFCKKFQDSPSHRIFGRMHEVLNINKK